MSGIRLANSFINTVKPGSYFEQKVESAPVGVSAAGNVVIIGESEEGNASKAIYSGGDSLKDNFFGPDQIEQVIAKYGRGPIVDMFNTLSAPSDDAEITGAPNRIYILKTNQSTKAQATVADAYGTLKHLGFGVAGNKYSYRVTEVQAESAAEAVGIEITSFEAALDAAEFELRVNGEAVQTITLGTGSHADITELLAELNGLLPADLEAVEGDITNSVVIRFVADANAHKDGFGKTLELIDSVTGDLAKLGLSEDIYVSSQEPEHEIEIIRQDINFEEAFSVEAAIALRIGYEGTTAELTITDEDLTTTVTGGSGSDLAIKLADYSTIQALADFINSQTGYTASHVSGSGSAPTSALDRVTSLGIATTEAEAEAGRVKRAAYNFRQVLDQSRALSFDQTRFAGLPDESALQFLSGGLKGSTSAADIVKAASELETINVNFVVPLFSRDATVDIADKLTDSSSTYTIDALHASIRNHVIRMANPKVKKHRSAMLSFWGSFTEAKQKAAVMSSSRISMAMQRSSQVDSQGVIKSFLPWHTAGLAAGMQSAGFYKAIFNKSVNILGIEDPTGYDSGSISQAEDAIESGLLTLEQDDLGIISFVVDKTTYLLDSNFVFNSIQAVYNADLVSLDLSASLKRSFIGKDIADSDPGSVIGFISSKFDAYRKQKLVVGDESAPQGFKNLKVRLRGPILEIQVEVLPNGAIYFAPITLRFSQAEFEQAA